MVQTDLQQTQPAENSQVGRRIFRATSALMLIQVVIKGFGIIEKSILGHLFGATYLTDAYMAARDIASYLLQFVDQVIMHSFIPVFIQRLREHGESDAWRLASTIMNLLVFIVTGLAVISVIYAPAMLPFFEPNWFAHPEAYPAELMPLTIKLTRAMLIAMVFLSTTSLTYSLLNAYKRFALPAAAEFAFKGTILIFAILFAKTGGPYAFALGFVCGAIAKLIVHGIGLGSRAKNYRPTIELRHPGLKRFAILIWPLLIGVSISIFRQIMDQRFTSVLPEGSMSAIKFARQLTDTPVSFFSLAFGIALFPFLTDIALAGDRERLRSMLMTATRMMILIFVPLAVMIIMLRNPIVLAVFGPNAMQTAEPLQIFALGMLFGALETIVLQFFYAMSDTFWPMVIAAVLVPIHIGTAYFGIFHWKLGVIAIALAPLLYKGTKVIVLYVFIRKKFTFLEGRKTLVFLGNIFLGLIPLFALLWLANHYLPKPVMMHQALVTAVMFTPDGKTLVSGSYYDHTISIWQAHDKVVIRPITKNADEIRAIALSADGKTFAYGNLDHTVKLRRVHDGTKLQTLDGHRDAVDAVTFSPDGQSLASGSGDQTVKLWRVSDGTLLKTFSGHTQGVTSVVFSTNNQWLASGDRNGSINIWQVRDGARMRTLDAAGATRAMAFSPDGRLLASENGNSTISIWQVQNGTRLRVITLPGGSLNTLVFSPNGNALASGFTDGTIKCWRVSDGTCLQTFAGHKSEMGALAFSPDGKTLASGNSNTIVLWRVPEGTVKQSYRSASKLRMAMALLPFVFVGILALAIYFVILYFRRIEEMVLLVQKIGGKLKRKTATA